MKHLMIGLFVVFLLSCNTSVEEDTSFSEFYVINSGVDILELKTLFTETKVFTDVFVFPKDTVLLGEVTTPDDKVSPEKFIEIVEVLRLDTFGTFVKREGPVSFSDSNWVTSTVSTSDSSYWYFEMK